MSGPDEGRTAPRRWLLRVGIGAALLCGLTAASLFAATRFLDPDQLARWLEPKMEAALGRDVEIGRARVDLFPPVAVVLEGLEIANPPGFSSDPFARVEFLRLDLSLAQILRRRVSVDEVRLVSPEIDVIVREDGTSNAEGFGGVGGEAHVESSAAAPFQVAIESIRIDDGSLTYQDEEAASTVVISPLRARFRVRTGSDHWTLRGTADARAGARTGGAAPRRVGPYAVRVQAQGHATNDLGTLRFEDSSVEVEGLALTLEADLEGNEAQGRTLSLRVRGTGLELEEVVSLLPDSLNEQLGAIGGTLGLDVTYHAEFGSGAPPELTGQIRLADAAVSRSDGEPGVSDVVGDVYLTLDSAWTTNLEGVVSGGPARVRGLLRAGERGGFVVRVAARPDLGATGGLVALPDGVTLAGGLSIDVTARGTLDDPARARLSGRAVPDGMRITFPGVGVPVSLPEGTVLLEGDVVRWRDLPVSLGDDRFTTSGQVRDVLAWAREGSSVPVVEGDFSGERLDFDEVFPGPPPDSTVLFGRLVFARLGEKAISGRTPREILEEKGFSRPRSLPLSGDISLTFATFLSAPHEFTDVRALLQFQPTLMQVSDIEAAAYGGRLDAAVDLGVGPDMDQPFSFSLSVDGVDAGDFLSATSPLGQVFDGTLTLNMDVSGDLDDVLLPTRSSVLGSGAFSLEGGSLHAGALTESISSFFRIPEIENLALSSWSAPFLVRDGRIVLRESALQGAFGDPRVAGTVGFGGQLALNLLFRLPSERLDGATLARLGVGEDVLRRIQAGSRPLDAALRVAGSVAEPLLSAEQSGVTQQLAEAVEDEAEAQVQEAIDERKQELEDRAADAVNRILRTDDTTGAEAPALTDLRRLLPPNLFRARPGSQALPDSVASPDSVAPRDSAAVPDSVQPDTTNLNR